MVDAEMVFVGVPAGPFVGRVGGSGGTGTIRLRFDAAGLVRRLVVVLDD